MGDDMKYTLAQYAVMERLSDGLIYGNLSAADQDIVRYLDARGIAQPRAYIADGYYRLSQDGERVLAAYHSHLNARKQKADQEAAEQAQQKAENRREHSFQIFLALFGAVVGAVLGNLDRIFRVISGPVVDLIKSLFG